jgi:hypothetical protein
MRFCHATSMERFGRLRRMPEDAYVEWLREGLRSPKTQTGLARALGIAQPQISRILAYDRKIKLSEIPKIATYLGSQPPDRAHLTVPIVGEVGAGNAAHFYAKGQGPFGDAPAPEGATDDTVALEVRGESLGSFFDDWLVYYDEARTQGASTCCRSAKNQYWTPWCCGQRA